MAGCVCQVSGPRLLFLSLTGLILRGAGAGVGLRLSVVRALRLGEASRVLSLCPLKGRGCRMQNRIQKERFPRPVVRLLQTWLTCAPWPLRQIQIYTHIYIYACIYIYVYLFIFIYIHMSIYIYIDMLTPLRHAEMHFFVPRYPQNHGATDPEFPKIQTSKNPRL